MYLRIKRGYMNNRKLKNEIAERAATLLARLIFDAINEKRKKKLGKDDVFLINEKITYGK